MARKLERKRELLLQYETVSSREMDVWQGIAAGLSNKQIAHQLDVYITSVENTINSLFAKFGCNRIQLARMYWLKYPINIKEYHAQKVGIDTPEGRILL